MKAIETQYKGYRFRSRLEARWAVFFEALGVKWEYEPEGFDLGNGVRYLPDFRVTSPQGYTFWYEVKPSNVASDPKFSLFEQNADDTAVAHTLLSGDPVEFFSDEQNEVCPRCGFIGKPYAGWAFCGDENHFGCHICDMNTPSGAGDEEDGFAGDCRPHKGWVVIDNYGLLNLKHRVRKAAEKARAARFEHGEVPA